MCRLLDKADCLLEMLKSVVTEMEVVNAKDKVLVPRDIMAFKMKMNELRCAVYAVHGTVIGATTRTKDCTDQAPTSEKPLLLRKQK